MKKTRIFAVFMIVLIMATQLAAAPAPASAEVETVAGAEPQPTIGLFGMPEFTVGEECPAPPEPECGKWSKCSVKCGGGTKTRTCTTTEQECRQEMVEEGYWKTKWQCFCGFCWPVGKVWVPPVYETVCRMVPHTYTETKPCNTKPCKPAEECPTYCGYEGGRVPNGDGTWTKCAATEECTACPSYPGYPGGDKVGDGEGGWIICPSIFDPNYDDFPHKPSPVQCETDTGDMTDKELAEQRAEVFYRYDTNIRNCDDLEWEYPGLMYYNGLTEGINGWTCHLEHGWRIYTYYDHEFYAVNYDMVIPAVQGIDGRWRVYLTGEDPENPIDKNVFFMLGSAEAGEFDWSTFDVEKRLDSDARYDDGTYVPIITQAVPYFKTDIESGNVLYVKDGGPSNMAFLFMTEVLGIEPTKAQELVEKMWKDKEVAIPGS